MKILFLSRLFYPHIGGVEAHIMYVSQELVKRGHSVSVITEQYDSTQSEVEEYHGIQIYRIPLNSEKKRKSEIWNYLWRNKNLIRSADIVHAHDVAFWFFPFRIFFPLKPFYVTFHGYEGIYPPTKKAIYIRKLSEYISWGTIVVGEYIKKWYKTKPDYVIYGAINPVNHQPSSSKKNNSKIKIVFIGRIEEDTGVQAYADVLKNLKEKKIPFEFSAVGDGSLKSIFQKYGRVTGFIRNPSAYSASADIIFASSYLSILESLSQKKKVLAVYTNPLKKDYLMLSPFKRYICISDSIQEMCDYTISKPTKEIEAGYKWVTTQTWEQLSETYLKLWRK